MLSEFVLCPNYMSVLFCAAVEPRQQMQMTVTADCLSPFEGCPALNISFKEGLADTRVDLHLPIVGGFFVLSMSIAQNSCCFYSHHLLSVWSGSRLERFSV